MSFYFSLGIISLLAFMGSLGNACYLLFTTGENYMFWFITSLVFFVIYKKMCKIHDKYMDDIK